MAWYVCQDLGIIPKDYPKQLKVKKTTQVPVAGDQMGWVHLGEIPENPTPVQMKEVETALKKAYKDVFDTDTVLPIMNGEPMRIHLKEGYKPYNLVSARTVPFAQRDAVKAEIDKMVRLGVAEPMGDEPSSWCHPLVVVKKKEKGELRVTVDLTKLNDQVQRVCTPHPHQRMSSLATLEE